MDSERFGEILIKSSSRLFYGKWKADPKTYMKMETNQNGQLTHTGFKIYYKTTLKEILWYLHKDNCKGQSNILH